MVITARYGMARFNTAPFNCTRAVRNVQLSCRVEGRGTMVLSAYAAGTLSVFRELAPGDVLVIDTEKFTVTINGQPVTDYTGRFFNIVPELTELIYYDNQTQRTIRAELQYTEKYL